MRFTQIFTPTAEGLRVLFIDHKEPFNFPDEMMESVRNVEVEQTNFEGYVCRAIQKGHEHIRLVISAHGFTKHGNRIHVHDFSFALVTVSNAWIAETGATTVCEYTQMDLSGQQTQVAVESIPTEFKQIFELTVLMFKENKHYVMPA